MDPRCTMGLSITLFVTALLLSGAASFKSQVYFNETAELPCQFTNSQNISQEELIVFWQDEQKLVLYEFYLSKVKPDNVDAKYMGRTSFYQDNWTVQLHNVQIKDRGTYDCFVHHKGPKGLIRLFQMSSELSVLANFSEPEIRPLSNITRNSGINLTCSSGQGYPQPIKMSFLLKTQNSTVEYDGVMAIHKDNDTGLYNVSTSLSVPFPDGVREVTIICVVYTDSTELFSPPFNTVLPDSSPPKGFNRTVWIAVVFIGVLAIILGLLIFKKTRKKKQQQQQQQQKQKQTAGSCEETTKMKSEETTTERVKIHVPEQNDEEAQCIVNYSKTPSGNKNATHF